jgi:hypothetical protein
VGAFYTNITLRTRDQARVAATLKAAKRQAFVSAPSNGCTVVYDRESEEQDVDVLKDLAGSLSARLGCVALAVLNHDDDVLIYTLHEDGRLVDEYNSSPEYFESGPGASPEGGDAERLCRDFGADGKVDDVETVLRTPWGTDDGFVFEMERHQELVTLLGLPSASVPAGYNYLEEGEFPDGLTDSDFIKVD